MNDRDFQDARERFTELLCELSPAVLAELALYFNAEPAQDWHLAYEPIVYNAQETARRIWMRMLEFRVDAQKVRDLRAALQAIS